MLPFITMAGRNRFLAADMLLGCGFQIPSNGSIRHVRNVGVLTQTSDRATQLAAERPGNFGRNQIGEHLQRQPITKGDLPRMIAPVGNIPYWQKIPLWKDVNEDEFLSYQWQVNKQTITVC